MITPVAFDWNKDGKLDLVVLSELTPQQADAKGVFALPLAAAQGSGTNVGR